MTKQIRKIQAEIDKNYKAIEDVSFYFPFPYTCLQGISVLEGLEVKLQSSFNQSQKEKIELEMKKEIKKLQRLREWFKASVNNPDIKDKTKLLEARKRIENVSYISFLPCLGK